MCQAESLLEPVWKVGDKAVVWSFEGQSHRIFNAFFPKIAPLKDGFGFFKQTLNVMGNVPFRQAHTFRVQPVVAFQGLSVATHFPAIAH